MTCRHLFSFPGSVGQTHVINIARTFKTHTPHTPVLWYFSGIHGQCPVVCLLQSSVCFVYGQWHAQALWGLTECEHCQKRLAACVFVCMCWLVDWWGDTSTDGGFRCDERHCWAFSCPLGSASRKTLLLPSKLTQTAHRPHQCPLCLLVPVSYTLPQIHTEFSWYGS